MRVDLPHDIAVRSSVGAVRSCCVAQTTRDAAACSALTSLQIPGSMLSITKAEWFARGLHAAPRRAGCTGEPGQSAGVLPSRRCARSPDGRRRQDCTASASRWRSRETGTAAFCFRAAAGLNGSVQPPLGWNRHRWRRPRSRADSRSSRPTPAITGQGTSTPASWPNSRRRWTSRIRRSAG